MSPGARSTSWSSSGCRRRPRSTACGCATSAPRGADSTTPRSSSCSPPRMTDEAAAEAVRRAGLRPGPRRSWPWPRDRSPAATSGPEALAQTLVAEPRAGGPELAIGGHRPVRGDRRRGRRDDRRGPRCGGREPCRAWASTSRSGAGAAGPASALHASWRQAAQALLLRPVMALATPDHPLRGARGPAPARRDPDRRPRPATRDVVRVAGLEATGAPVSDLDLLERYLATMSLRQTAQQVLLHHTTVQYRLKRIEQRARRRPPGSRRRACGRRSRSCCTGSSGPPRRRAPERASAWANPTSVDPRRDAGRDAARDRPVPAPGAGRVPAVLARTPYGTRGNPVWFPAIGRLFADNGMAFVAQDTRGHHGSEGAAVPFEHEATRRLRHVRVDRPPAVVRRDARRVRRVVRRVHGVRRCRRRGHPAIRAAALRATTTDIAGDWLRHQGVLRLEFVVRWALAAWSGRDNLAPELDWTCGRLRSVVPAVAPDRVPAVLDTLGARRRACRPPGRSQRLAVA